MAGKSSTAPQGARNVRRARALASLSALVMTGCFLACSGFDGESPPTVDAAVPDEGLRPPDADGSIVIDAGPDVVDGGTPCDPLFTSTIPFASTSFDDGVSTAPWLVGAIQSLNCSSSFADVDGGSKSYSIDCTAASSQTRQLETVVASTSFAFTARVTDPSGGPNTPLVFYLATTDGPSGGDPNFKLIVLADGSLRVVESLTTGQMISTDLTAPANSFRQGVTLGLAFRPPRESSVGKLALRIDGACVLARDVATDQQAFVGHTNAVLRLGRLANAGNTGNIAPRSMLLDDLVLGQ